jgi:DNA (cytosine-5)-methyltransferase 1
MILEALGRSYIIENVPGAPLLNPVRLCGSAFGLGVRRHRLFESNLEISGVRCDHASQEPKYHIYDHGRWYLSPVAHVHGHGGGKSKGAWAEAMGIDWMNDRELAQAIPPCYTEHVGKQVIEQLSGKVLGRVTIDPTAE